MSTVLPLLGFCSGLILATTSFSQHLKSLFSSVLSRLFIPIVIIYNMVFYQAGSLGLMLFSFFSAVLLFFIYLFLSKDRLQSLCFSYTNMAWLGFPIATAILTVVIGMLFGATIPAAGISGAVLGILLWYAFDRLLDVTLPLGAWLG